MNMSLYRTPLVVLLRFPSKVDSAADFVDDDDEDIDMDEPDQQANIPLPKAKPLKQKRLTAKSTPAPGNSLEVLDACLPEEPRDIPQLISTSSSRDGSSTATTILGELPVWLQQALFATTSEPQSDGGAGPPTSPSVLPLTARLAPLAQRMRSLLRRGVYARQKAGKTISMSMAVKSGGWAESGRPAGFVGAGLAEELCLAVFGRIQSLRAKSVGKQVCRRWLLRTTVLKFALMNKSFAASPSALRCYPTIWYSLMS